MDSKPVFRVGAAGLDPRDWRLIEIVFKHSQYNKFEFRLVTDLASEPFDVLIVNAIEPEGLQALMRARASTRTIPVITAVPRGAPSAAKHAISIDRLTLQLLPILNRVVELELLPDGPTAAGGAVPAGAGAAPGRPSPVPVRGEAVPAVPGASAGPPAASGAFPAADRSRFGASPGPGSGSGFPSAAFGTDRSTASAAAPSFAPVATAGPAAGTVSAGALAGRSPGATAPVADATASSPDPGGSASATPSGAQARGEARFDARSDDAARASGAIGASGASRPSGAITTPAATSPSETTPSAPIPSASAPLGSAPSAPAPSAPAPSNLVAFPRSHIAEGANNARLRVLIVDDSPTVRRQLSGALERLGVASEAVESARQALQRLSEQHFDLALLDIVMPDMDGYRLTREIKRNKQWRQLPVIILTSRSSPFDLARGALAGCDAYLTKPVPFRALEAAIVKQLRRSLAIDDLSGLIRPSAPVGTPPQPKPSESRLARLFGR